jgi:protoheme IX farnesyltransferase
VISVVPAFGFTGTLFITPYSAVLVGIAGLWFLSHGIKLYNKRDSLTARKLMFVSVSYISLLQIIYVLDKFIR